ncbi:MAG: protein translocase subunit SecD [Pseudomonadaceae bacterium]|nr:protein translocase subunit SecD [Pseudomonadaceae bacterium]
MRGQLSVFQRAVVVVVLVLSALYALPNLLPEGARESLPSFMPNQPMTLGLDLQGGAHLALQVRLDDVKNHAYETLGDEVRAVARENDIGYTGLRASVDGVTLALRDPTQQPLLASKLGRTVQVKGDGASGNLTLTYTEDYQAELMKRAMGQTLQVLRSRVDEFGVAEPLVQQQGTDRVIVQLPGARDVARAKAAIGRTAQLTFHMVDERADPYGVVPPNKLKLEEVIADKAGNEVSRQPLVVERRPSLTGDMLTSAGSSFDQYGNPAVDIAFDRRGTRLFADLSTKRVGQRFAIVLDGTVYSAPVFREPILGGRAQITGNFSVEEAQDLAAILNAGALPAGVDVVEERTVGPTLGADSVKAGQLAMVLGFVAVLVFMFLFYGVFGLVANVALVANLLLLLAAMSAFGFTLTLPGMAAIVLTLGMAVDANVLIFERIREEVRAGKKPLAALQGGFDGAYATILDSNITTLMGAVVLFAMGSGPIRGFAVALSIGLLASMFTAITLTRWMLMGWVLKKRPMSLPV